MLVDGSVAEIISETMNNDVSTTVTHPAVVETQTTSATPAMSLMTSGPPPPPPPSDYGQQDPPDTKEGIEELCPVCGDKVSGYHYGLLTCESCKGFFKRTVQNRKVYTCVGDRNCHIDKSQRKRCPFCRFQKCLDVGMKLEAVRADRMRGGRNKFGPMYKRDRARRLQMMRQRQITRNQCQGPSASGGSEMGPGGPSYTPVSMGMSPHHVYSPDGPAIKQELIQIPQLSSSTSSPDSSPSPLSTTTQVISSMSNHYSQPNGQAAMHSPLHQPLSETVKVSWVTTHAPSTPTPSTPSPGHTASAASCTPPGALSPKTFHFEAAQTPGPPVPAPVPLLSGSGQIPAMVREFQSSMLDDKEWQSQLYGLLRNQTYNQCEVDLFELMCKVIDQALFSQVDWARNSIFFKELKVDDQMKLLQHSWSDMLILDHLHQRLHNGLPDETTLPNGQKFSLLTLALLGLPTLADQLHRIANKLQELKFDPIDYLCLKFLLLLNPGEDLSRRQHHQDNPEARGLSNIKLVREAYEQAQQTLMEYTINCYPQITDKFSQLLQQLPELHMISSRGEEYLYYRHLSGNAPTQTLLMEMLHAKRK